MTNLVLDNLELLEFPATRENGDPWDNAFASYKPDIYLKITDFHKNPFYVQPNYFNNLTNNKLPRTFEFTKEIKLSKDQYNDGLVLFFYDHDSATSHDLVGYVALNKFKEHYNSNKTTQLLELNGIKAKLTFHYE